MKKALLLFTAVMSFGLIMGQTSVQQQIEEGVTNYKNQSSDQVVLKKLSPTTQASKTTLNESFEGTNFPPAGWSTIDADGDGNDFFAYTGGSAHTGLASASSASWTSTAGALTPNNHLITPGLIVSSGDTLSFWYAAQDPSYPSDKFQVLVSTTSPAAANFTDTLWVKTITDSTWTQKQLDLSSYAGDTIYLSFNHFDCTDWFYMKLDDIMAPSTIYVAPDMAVTDITSLSSACSLGQEDVTIEVTNLGGDSVSTFDVAFKVDNGSYTTESYSGAAIQPGASATYTFTAKADLSAAGAHTVTAKVIYTGDNNAANDMDDIIVSNLAPKAIPYTMGFETGESLDGWMAYDANMDGTSWAPIENGVNPHNGTGYVYCVTPSSDDWLVTTCLTLSTGVNYEVSAYTKTKTAGNESFSFYIGQGNAVADMTTKLSDNSVAADSYYRVAQPFTVSSDGTYYIGIHANSAASAQTLYIDDIMIDDLITSISTSDAAKAVKMYPNPAQNVLRIKAASAIESIQIANVIGQTVKVLNPATAATSMNISELNEGIYFVTIQTATSKTVKKLTIKR